MSQPTERRSANFSIYSFNYGEVRDTSTIGRYISFETRGFGASAGRKKSARPPTAPPTVCPGTSVRADHHRHLGWGPLIRE